MNGTFNAGKMKTHSPNPVSVFLAMLYWHYLFFWQFYLYPLIYLFIANYVPATIIGPGYAMMALFVIYFIHVALDKSPYNVSIYFIHTFKALELRSVIDWFISPSFVAFGIVVCLFMDIIFYLGRWILAPF